MPSAHAPVLHTPPNPPTPPLNAGPVAGVRGSLRLILSSGSITVEAPRGWRDRALVQRDIDALRPALLRALAPDIGECETWSSQWMEAFQARAQVAQDAGDPTPEQTALDDLRVAVWSGTVAGLIPLPPRFVDDTATWDDLGPQWWAE